MKEKDLTKKVLEKVANELSEVMDFEIPIEVADDITDIDLLRSDIIEAAGELIADDEITEETKEVLIFLGIKLPWKVEKKVEKKKVTKSNKEKVETKSIKKTQVVDKKKMPVKSNIKQKSKEKSNSAVQNSANFIMVKKNFTKKELIEHLLSSGSCGIHYSKLIADTSIKLLLAIGILEIGSNKNSFKLKK